ncbi:uncharacterized protein CLUP02_18072 [Colletotrichum lupini]|uniref:Uncharacterized protein n=1 Tax=Colletotrichum lupini TaxID=145971 RepID=A0A9Q8SFY5_9PEZI|nr:uncharacterized protein CLUP02_18072 [Colletotrichum lupini]UQC76559.1 hypothetical protein CLUP02_18072 [Colletotrichum lupini]
METLMGFVCLASLGLSWRRLREGKVVAVRRKAECVLLERSERKTFSFVGLSDGHRQDSLPMQDIADGNAHRGVHSEVHKPSRVVQLAAMNTGFASNSFWFLFAWKAYRVSPTQTAAINNRRSRMGTSLAVWSLVEVVGLTEVMVGLNDPLPPEASGHALAPVARLTRSFREREPWLRLILVSFDETLMQGANKAMSRKSKTNDRDIQSPNRDRDRKRERWREIFIHSSPCSPSALTSSAPFVSTVTYLVWHITPLDPCLARITLTRSGIVSLMGISPRVASPACLDYTFTSLTSWKLVIWAWWSLATNHRAGNETARDISYPKSMRPNRGYGREYSSTTSTCS